MRGRNYSPWSTLKNATILVCCRPTGSYTETLLAKMSYLNVGAGPDLPEADFWPGTTFGLLVTPAEPAIAVAPWVNANRLLGADPAHFLEARHEWVLAAAHARLAKSRT